MVWLTLLVSYISSSEIFAQLLLVIVTSLALTVFLLQTTHCFVDKPLALLHTHSSQYSSVMYVDFWHSCDFYLAGWRFIMFVHQVLLATRLCSSLWPLDFCKIHSEVTQHYESFFILFYTTHSKHSALSHTSYPELYAVNMWKQQTISCFTNEKKSFYLNIFFLFRFDIAFLCCHAFILIVWRA